MATQVNQLLESMKYSDLETFMRSRDNREAIASYIIDEGTQMTFFDQFPKLIYRDFQVMDLVGDLAKVRHYNIATGVGLPGPYKASRQLAGSEAMASAAFREETLSLGMHRYAVAMENFFDKALLPATIVASIFGGISKWWAERDDVDTFFTLFRDYPSYWAESLNLTATEKSIRVGSLIGRGTYNDIGSSPEVIFAGNGTKNDIEQGPSVTGFKSVSIGDRVGLAITDTLTDTFIKNLEQYVEFTMNMPKDVAGGYSIIANQSDINNLYDNSSATLVANLKSIAVQNQGKEVFKTHPIFTRMLDNIYGINFFKFEPAEMADGNSTGITRPLNSVKDRMRGTPINPQAQILAAAIQGDTVTGLSVWNGGDYSATPANRSHAEASGYYLYCSSGADHFPFFDGTTASLGVDSINSIDVGLHGGGAATNAFYGRLQVGQGTTATTKWKVVYKGPLYTGTIQVGSNNDKVSFIENAYRLKIVTLHRWNAGAGNFDADSLAADWATFKTFLGINASSKVVDVAAAFQNRTYQVNRRIHFFDCVRSIVYGRDLLYRIPGTGNEYAEETRDYNAITGRSLTVKQGKKIVTDAQGVPSNYAIVVFKRPPYTI